MQPAIEQLREALHIDRVRDEISELEQRVQEPGFWDDVDRAQKMQMQMKHLQRKIDRYERLKREHDDLMVLN